MDKRKTFSMPAVGGSALITMFAVLCLTVFALLTLSTALSGARLSSVSAEGAENYYAADTQAEEIFARLRAGELPPEVREENGIYTYSCPIGSSAFLEVELRLREGCWEVLRWQSCPADNWETDDSLPVA